MPNKRTVTAERLAANRAAAQKSTGPKTPEGKQRAAFNSFQHGAFAGENYILHERMARSGYEPALFGAARQSLLDDWQPSTRQQELLVDDLAWLYWLRDQSRLALLESQAGCIPAAQLRRDQRRFEDRHRDTAVDGAALYGGGFVAVAACPDKFTVIAGLLDDLKECLLQGNWSEPSRNGHGLTPSLILTGLYDSDPSTARGRKLRDLWSECKADTPGPDDPRMQQMLAWIAEEHAALLEEEQLFRRQKELENEQDEHSDALALCPLDETWQEMVRQLQQLDRQINAKIRLLLHLQRAASPAAAPIADPDRLSSAAIPAQQCGSGAAAAAAGEEISSEGAPFETSTACPEPDLGTVREVQSPRPSDSADLPEIHGTNPKEPLESTTGNAH